MNTPFRNDCYNCQALRRKIKELEDEIKRLKILVHERKIENRQDYLGCPYCRKEIFAHD